MKTKFLLATALYLGLLPTAHAWGRRGHQIVVETAVRLLDDDPTGHEIWQRSFDMGVYANVPDIVWKRPEHFDLERPQHYMDLDVIRPALKAHPDVKDPLKLTRREFDAKFPELTMQMGRAFWRVRELLERLEAVTAKLKVKSLERKAHQAEQQNWLLLAGVIGHYVGDLGQPLHTVLDYDAEKSGQQGLHRFFEDDCVDFYYPQLTIKVLNEARRAWPAFKKKNSGTEVIDLLDQLATASNDALPALLKIDKAAGRDPRTACPKHEPMLVRRMVASTLTLAEIYRRQLGWTFDDKRFFTFNGDPAYIPIGEAN